MRNKLKFPFEIRITERLVIRKLLQSDCDDLLEIYSDPVVVKNWGMNPLTLESEVSEIVSSADSSFNDSKSITLGIVEKETEKLIGLLLMFNLNESSNRAEVGYALNQSYWGMGYMQEAFTSFIEYLLHDLAIRRLEADINPTNAASAKVLLKAGFLKEGLLRSRWEFNGVANDAEIYGLLNPNINKPVLERP